jgi:hypothetical protein
MKNAVNCLWNVSFAAQSLVQHFVAAVFFKDERDVRRSAPGKNSDRRRRWRGRSPSSRDASRAPIVAWSARREETIEPARPRLDHHLAGTVPTSRLRVTPQIVALDVESRNDQFEVRRRNGFAAQERSATNQYNSEARCDRSNL